MRNGRGRNGERRNEHGWGGACGEHRGPGWGGYMKEHLAFTKMQAYGNDYVYIDAIHQNIEAPGTLAKMISDRHFGVGSDGLVLICPSNLCDFRMRIFNPDGTEAEMCGNALRSTAKFVYFHHLTQKEQLTIETIGGIQTVELFVQDGEVVNIRANIGKPEFRAEKIPVLTEGDTFLDQKLQVADKVFRASALSWGNPHTVLLTEELDELDLGKYGRLVEHMECFPARTNVTFAQIVDESHLRIREWERGTGETIGCGTGCCSAVVIGNLLGLCGRKVICHQIGGDLDVEWDAQDVVHMTGPSHIVYQGEYLYEAESAAC